MRLIDEVNVVLFSRLLVLLQNTLYSISLNHFELLNQSQSQTAPNPTCPTSPIQNHIPCTMPCTTHARPSLPVTIFPIRPLLTEGHFYYTILLLNIPYLVGNSGHSLNNGPLNDQIHFFHSYLDPHCIFYLRNKIEPLI